MRYQLSPAANEQVDHIYEYTAERWGDDQAVTYTQALFAEIDMIAKRRLLWRKLPAVLDIAGYSRSWRQHVIYWREAGEEEITVFAILHERMDQPVRLREVLPGNGPD